MERKTRFLIVGAGPFGLAAAALARRRGVEHVVVGVPMSFWEHHMPAGMVLRSAGDWHLDPSDELTFDRFLAARGGTCADSVPLPIELYLEYAEWFRAQAGIDVLSAHVRRLDATDGADGSAARFRATLDGGDTIDAESVLLAVGVRHFAHMPEDLLRRLPAGRTAHTCDVADMRPYEGQRVLIVGGRQSAFEWAALLAEAGAARVDVVHRHDSPRFAESDWSWVGPLVQRFVDEPGWYRRLDPSAREKLNRRFWEEGRLKVEPWLGPRCAVPAVRIRPRSQVVSSTPRPDRSFAVALDTGETLAVDRIVLATGFRPDLEQVPLLTGGDLLPRIASSDGFPLLDDALQTSVPGLFVTSALAVREFGPFFGFTVSARASARIVVRALGA